MPAIVEISLKLNAAVKANKTYCTIRWSVVAETILTLMLNHGFIFSFSIEPYSKNTVLKQIKVYLAYVDHRPVLKEFVLVSTPSRRVFGSYESFIRMLKIRFKNKNNSVFINIPRSVLYIFSTHKGIISHWSLLRLKIGGVLLAYCEV